MSQIPALKPAAPTTRSVVRGVPSLSPVAVSEALRHWLAVGLERSDLSAWTRRLLLLVPLYAVFRTVYFPLTKLPEASYFSGSITLASVTHLPALALWGITAVWIAGTWRMSWADFSSSMTLRNLVCCFVAILTWTFCLYDYNLYYDQAHLFDRGLLFVLGVAVWFRPGLLSPWLMLVYLITHQFDYPLPCTWTDKRAMFDALTLCQAYLVLLVTLQRGAIRETESASSDRLLPLGTLFIALGCLQAANYFYPGWGKLVLGWHFVERLDNLFIASWLNGWLGFLSEADALAWAAWIAEWNWFLVWSSLILELGVVACFWRRWPSIALWASCIGLHAMICLTTGILFWKWMLLDAGLIAVLLWHDRTEVLSWFTPAVRWVSLGLIITAPLTYQPIWLAWYDTELNDHYHLQAVTAEGHEYFIPRTSLTPQEVYFAQNKFHFLVPDEKFVVGRYGTTPDVEMMRRLDGRPTAELATAVCAELGDVAFHERKAADFERFIQRYYSAANRHASRNLLPEWLRAPQHIYSWCPTPALPPGETVREVRVIHVRALYQRDRIETLQQHVVRVIPIPQ